MMHRFVIVTSGIAAVLGAAQFIACDGDKLMLLNVMGWALVFVSEAWR